MTKKYLLILTLFSVLMVCMGCACAADINDGFDDDVSLNEANHQSICKDMDSIETNSDDSIKNSNADYETSSQESEGFSDNQEVYFEGTTFSQLQKKILSLEPGKTLVLSNNITQDGNAPMGIFNTVTIDGNGMTMDAKNLSRTFIVLGDNVTLKNICFVNGRPAIQWLGVNGTVMDCSFKNNIGHNKGMVEFRDPTIKLNETGYEKLGFKFIDNKLISGMDLDEYLNTPMTVTFTGSTFSELKSLIKTLKKGDTLILAHDAYQTNEYPIIIDFPLTIIGNGHTLDGKHLSKIFEISADNVVLNNIVFINGNGAIKWYNNNVGTVNGCTFKNNMADEGGALEWLCNNGTIKNSTFIANKAKNGGAIYLNANNCKLEGCTFQDNTATNGGAFYICPKNPKLNNCNAPDNYAKNCKIEGCNFQKNTANNLGGAVFLCANNVKVEKCDFKDNKAKNGGAIGLNPLHYGFIRFSNINSCTFSGNLAAEEGGAIYLDSRDTYARNCIFNQNRAQRGGAINFKTTGAHVVGSSFEKNSAKDGGAIFITYCAPYWSIEKSDFTENTATGTGAGVYCYSQYGYYGDIIDCDFYKNQGKTSIISFIYQIESTRPMTLKGCNFYANKANYIIECAGEEKVPTASNSDKHLYGEAWVTNCIFFKNTGWNILDKSSLIKVNNCWFGNTKSKPCTDWTHVGGEVKIDHWYVLNDDFTTSYVKLCYPKQVSLKKLKSVNKCELRISEKLRLILLKLK